MSDRGSRRSGYSGLSDYETERPRRRSDRHRDHASSRRVVGSFVTIVAVIGLSIAGAAFVANVLFPPAPMVSGGSSAPVARQPAQEEAPFTPDATSAPAARTEVAPSIPPAAEPTQQEAVPAPVTPTAPSDAAAPDRRAVGVVCIDAGHQANGDSSLEPIGPGAKERKPKVTGGASGVSTRKPESLINLQVARRLRDELEQRGITVVMVRDEQDVNISNSKRAKVANSANADVFVRLHCDGAGTRDLHGLSTLIPARNRWTGPILDESAQAGRLIHKAAIKATGAKDRGVVKRSDLSGFNWSEVPTVLVEMGFMSNPAEDRRLKSEAYQEKLASGIADGIIDYLEQRGD